MRHVGNGQLATLLTSAPILAHPDFKQKFIVDTDASAMGIVAVLSQVQEDGQERVVAYASRVLTNPERRYCVTRRELLAVITLQAIPAWTQIPIVDRPWIISLALKLPGTRGPACSLD